METQLTCFNKKKHMIPALGPHTEHLQTTGGDTQANPPANRSRCIAALLKFYLLSASNGHSAHGTTPSVHFNMNGSHVSLVLLERRRCEIAGAMWSGPDTQG